MTFVNLPPVSADAVAWLQSLALTHGLPPSALHMLAAGAVLRQHGAGTVLFEEGAPARHWLGVVQGCVEVVRFTSQGQERVFHCFHSGHCLAEAAMFMPHGRYPMQARAGAASAVWRLCRHALLATCQAHPVLALRLLESFSQRLYHSINQVEWLSMSSAPQRLAAELLQLPRQQGAALQMPCSQRQLAGQLGMRPETLNRLLADWQRRGWLKGQGRDWKLLDVEALQGLASASMRRF